ncbi:MAG: TonB-dependent receptor [Saprospiraceae bacterium]|nr:TonB-dependent receptor [Saprospiraceae bacterium]
MDIVYNLKFVSFSICMLMVGFSQDLFAQSAADTTLQVTGSEVVVSATRSSTSAARLPLNIEVITQRQIEENQPVSPTEALQYIPGVTRQSDGGLASTPIIRGLSRERAPILIDGNPFVGGRIRSYGLVDPFQIDQIEVIKGPASAFWGSDAVSGLVNIVTRKAENGFGKEFKMGGSLYGGFQSVNELGRGRAEIEGRGKGFDFLIGGGFRNASNTKTPEGEIENSQFESSNVDFNIGYALAANQRIELSGKYFENRNAGFPGGLGAPGPPRIDRRFDPDIQKGINLSYDATDLSDKVAAIGARIFFKKQELHIDQKTNVFFPMTTNVNRKIHVMLDVDVPFMGGKFFTTLRQKNNARLTLGVDYLREHRIGTHRDLNIQIFNPMGVMVNEVNRPYGQIQPDSYSNSIGLFAIEEMHLGENLDLLLAARIDNVSTSIEDGPFDIAAIENIYNPDNTSDSDLAASGNIGLKFRASESFALSANLANSFRGTDLFSKYHFTTVGAGFLVPNPDLDPERGVFYELGVEYGSDAFSFDVAFFQNFLNDLFVLQDLTFADAPSVQFQNIGEATLTGLEWNARAKINTLSYVFLSGALIDGTNKVTDNPLPQIPAFQSWLGVHFRDVDNRFYVQPEVFFVGEQNDFAPNEIATPGYTILNLKAGLNLHNVSSGMPHAKLILSVTNIGNKAYRSHVSRGAPGNQNTFMEAGRSFNLAFVTRFGAAVHGS